MGVVLGLIAGVVVGFVVAAYLVQRNQKKLRLQEAEKARTQPQSFAGGGYWYCWTDYWPLPPRSYCEYRQSGGGGGGIGVQ